MWIEEKKIRQEQQFEYLLNVLCKYENCDTEIRSDCE